LPSSEFELRRNIELAFAEAYLTDLKAYSLLTALNIGQIIGSTAVGSAGT